MTEGHSRPLALPETVMVYLDAYEISSIVLGASHVVTGHLGKLRFQDEQGTDISPLEIDLAGNDAPIRREFGVGVSDIGDLLAGRYVTSRIVIQCPSISKYGLPPLAQELQVDGILKADFGFEGQLFESDIDLFDLGDDGGGFTLVVLRLKSFGDDESPKPVRIKDNIVDAWTNHPDAAEDTCEVIVPEDIQRQGSDAVAEFVRHAASKHAGVDPDDIEFTKNW